jgi:transposase InsO family protein
MPWKATDPLKERTKFLLEWERRWDEAQGGPVNLAELCRMFGISRATGYTWVKRYRDANLEIAAAINERSRRPKTSTLLDAYSRFLLRCEALLEPDGKHVRSVLDSAFLEFGVPKAIRSDGGPPFASSGPARLTELSVWLLRLGVRIEIIAPGKPQQNGRLERFHRTLAEDTASPPAESCAAQQRRFDLNRREYNQERPHESLAMRPPARMYTPSSRTYPRPLLRRTPEPFSREVRVDKQGFITWNRRKVFISSALRCEYIELDFDPDGRWAVRWGAIPLGLLDEHAPERGLIVTRRRRGEATVVGQSYVDV